MERFNANYISYFETMSFIHLNSMLAQRKKTYGLFSFPSVCVMSVTNLVCLLLFF